MQICTLTQTHNHARCMWKMVTVMGHKTSMWIMYVFCPLSNSARKFSCFTVLHMIAPDSSVLRMQMKLTYQRQKQTSSMSGPAWSSSAFLQDPEDSASTDQSLAVAFSTLEAHHLPTHLHLLPKDKTSNN